MAGVHAQQIVVGCMPDLQVTVEAPIEGQAQDRLGVAGMHAQPIVVGCVSDLQVTVEVECKPWKQPG